MSDYTKTTDFAVKDGLASGNPAKVIKGTEIDVEFDNVQTANNTKMNNSNPNYSGELTGFEATFTGTMEAALVDGGTY